MVATDATAAPGAVSGSACDAEAAPVLTTTVASWFINVEPAGPVRFVGALSAEFRAGTESPCGASGITSSCEVGDCTGVAEGAGTRDSSTSAEVVACSAGTAAAGCSVGDTAIDCSAGESAATTVGASVWVGVDSAEAGVSLLDGVGPVCAAAELWTTPERGSAVDSCCGEDVELVSESTGFCTFAVVELDVADADEVAAEAGSVDDVLAPDSDDELDVDDDPSDELEELGSVVSANATAGVFATATPTPSANARTPARTICCASAGIAIWEWPARTPTHRPPETT